MEEKNWKIALWGTTLAEETFNTSSASDWEQISMNIADIPTSTLIEGVVLLLNAPTATEDTVYLDNFILSYVQGASVSETNILTDISVFPNPTNGLVEIRGLNRDVQIEVYNFEGKFIKSCDQPFIDLNAHPKGKYIIKLVSEYQVKEFVTIKN